MLVIETRHIAPTWTYEPGIGWWLLMAGVPVHTDALTVLENCAGLYREGAD